MRREERERRAVEAAPLHRDPEAEGHESSSVTPLGLTCSAGSASSSQSTPSRKIASASDRRRRARVGEDACGTRAG